MLRRYIWQLSGSHHLSSSDWWHKCEEQRSQSLRILLRDTDDKRRESTGIIFLLLVDHCLNLETQVLLCKTLRYFQAEDSDSLGKEIEEISRMLATLVSKLL